MSIAKVKLIDINANVSNLDNILMRFIEIKNFHPVLASEIVEKVHGLTAFVAENPCQTLLTDLTDLETKYELNLPVIEQHDIDYNFNEMYDYMSNVRGKLEVEMTHIKDLEEHIAKYRDALIQVEHIQELDIPLDDLFACDHLKIRFGRMPNDSVEKLWFFQSKPYVFKSFSHDQYNSWCMYFTTNEYKKEVDNIFSALFFERVFIPDFVHGKPKDAVEALRKEIENAEAMINSYKSCIYDITCGLNNPLAVIKGELQFLTRLFEAKKYVVGLGDRFSISGFVEENDVKNIKKAFSGVSDIEISVNDAYSDKRIKPPTKLKNGWFSRPFSMFVEMYGLPDYNEIDPTPFVAFTYALLFGMMFGDLGQGLVLILVGFLLYKFKKMRLGAIGIRVGISSALFGLLYGSFFGNEEILNPFFTQILGLSHKPVHIMDPNFTQTLLIISVAMGSLFIVISMFLNMYILLKKKEHVEIFTSHNGVPGLILYGFVVTAAVMQLGYGVNLFSGLYIIGFVALPLLTIFLKEPIHRAFKHEKLFSNGFGGFFVEGFFELFEIILSYVTNTMSFLRVGGFVLAHAGMMLVVMSLMEMMGDSGWIVLILGNLFVMGLEGLIVGIQVLRLEFYEMFSRYYKGNGVAFDAVNN